MYLRVYDSNMRLCKCDDFKEVVKMMRGVKDAICSTRHLSRDPLSQISYISVIISGIYNL